MHKSMLRSSAHKLLPGLYLSVILFLIAPALVFATHADEARRAFQVLDLWLATPPGEEREIGKERDTTTATNRMVAGRRVIRLGDVSKPTISIYKPSPEKDTGAAVLVCPGGGYNILAIDLEGTEIAD